MGMHGLHERDVDESVDQYVYSSSGLPQLSDGREAKLIAIGFSWSKRVIVPDWDTCFEKVDEEEEDSYDNGAWNDEGEKDLLQDWNSHLEMTLSMKSSIVAKPMIV
jgi:hypothetical protein